MYTAHLATFSCCQYHLLDDPWRYLSASQNPGAVGCERCEARKVVKSTTDSWLVMCPLWLRARVVCVMDSVNMMCISTMWRVLAMYMGVIHWNSGRRKSTYENLGQPVRNSGAETVGPSSVGRIIFLVHFGLSYVWNSCIFPTSLFFSTVVHFVAIAGVFSVDMTCKLALHAICTSLRIISWGCDTFWVSVCIWVKLYCAIPRRV